MTELARGQVLFDRYQVVDKIGQGGMAEIYSAVSAGAQGFTKFFAVKRILDAFASQPKFRDMFVAEARLAALLHHPNIVQTIEFVEQGQDLFLVMELVAGVNLSHALRRCVERDTPLPLPEILYIAIELLHGLDYAHRKTDSAGRPLRLVHRDVSPSNVLLSLEGLVKLSDFGIAKARFIPSLTQQGAIKGKVGYMAPEVVAGRAADARADVWGAGVVLWEMLANRRMLPGQDHEVIQAVLQRQLPSLRARRPELPEALHAVVEAALAPDPDQRFSGAGAMAHALSQTSHALDLYLSAEVLQGRLQLLFPDALRHLQEVSNEFALVPMTAPRADSRPAPAPVLIDDEPPTQPATPSRTALASGAQERATAEVMVGTLLPDAPPPFTDDDVAQPTRPLTREPTRPILPAIAAEAIARSAQRDSVSARAQAQRGAALRVGLFIALALVLLGGGAWLVDRFALNSSPVDSLPGAAAAEPARVAAREDAATLPPASAASRGQAAPDAASLAIAPGTGGTEDAAVTDAAPATATPARRPVKNGGQLHVVVRPAATLYIDGAEVAREVEDFTTTLAPGAHLVEARAAGFSRPARRRVVVKPGHAHRVDLHPTR